MPGCKNIFVPVWNLYFKIVFFFQEFLTDHFFSSIPNFEYLLISFVKECGVKTMRPKGHIMDTLNQMWH